MKKFFTALCGLLFFTIVASAQIKVSGLVTNAKAEPLANVAVSFTAVKDNSAKVSTATNESGNFTATIPAAGKYRMIASRSGFQEYAKVITIATSTTIETIALQNNNTIGGVKVTADKVVTKINVDKKVYNVGQDITASGGSASDVLKNVPSLTVDPVDGGVSIRGNDNILVLVDGKPSTLLGSDIATVLQGIPSSSIESVEVVNNPGAQYDAQGKGGVLNIILKKDRKAGYNGNAGLSVGLPARINGNIGMNANVKKWNLFANVSGRASQTFIKDKIERYNYYNDITSYTDAYTSRNPKSGFINFGADYNLDKYNKFTLSQNMFGANMSGDITTNIYADTLFTKQIQRAYRYNVYSGRPRNETTSFNYTHTGKKKPTEFKVDASLGISQYLRTSDIVTDTFNAMDNIVSANNQQSIPIKGGNNNFTASTDYSTPLAKASKLDIGAKVINFVFRSENFPTYRYQGGELLNDAKLKNHYKFSQNTYAAYTNYKTQIKKYSMQLGLRFEHFVYDGTVYQTNTPLHAEFNNLFPSAYFTRKVNKDAELTLSYTKRVNRPNFFQMVPYIDVTNPQDTSMGNPALHPEFIHASELSFYKPINGKNNILASVYYQYNKDLIQRYKRFNSNGTSFTQPLNIDFGVTYGAELNVKYYLLKNWDANFNVNVFNNIINGTSVDASLQRQGWSGFAKVISNYKFNKKWDFQLTGNYQAPAVIAQGKTKAYGNIDAAIKTNLLNNALTLSLNANDIFNTTFTGSVYDVPNLYHQYNYRKPQTQQVTIGAQFRFLSKNTNPADVKDRKFGKKGMEKDNKDIKSRDENLKKDDDKEDNNGGGNNNNNNSGGQQTK
ncbi:MAG: hypothetical protein RLZZ118_1628 [Bacteroidota bacterium]|jgi:outer membrane receptor protein involved in Fe transport